MKGKGLPNDLKFVITLICLFVLYPVGLILMYAWTNWPKWLKVIITLPAVYAVIVGFIIAIDFSRSVKQEASELRLKEAEIQLNCSQQCAQIESPEFDYCMEECSD